MIKHETLRVLTDIIQCLKPRERAIFESHFFDQLSPAEIARLFNLSSSNVYQILSRSRKKVVQENLRVTVDTYIKTRRDLGMMAKRFCLMKGHCGKREHGHRLPMQLTNCCSLLTVNYPYRW